MNPTPEWKMVKPEELLNFFMKVEKSKTGCWLWTGTKTKDGYGSINFRRKSSRAHRISHLLFKGEIPPGLTIDHLCRVRSCVNPKHLEAVTLQVNCSRGDFKTNSHHAKKTHCPSGHPYDEANTLRVLLPTGKFGRKCRACLRFRQRKNAKSN